jgi:hypothetical protein
MGLNVTIGFSTTNRLMSRLIRWVTGGKVSHTWIALDIEPLGQRFVMQAEWHGYELRPISRWRRENIWVAEFTPLGAPLELPVRRRARSLGCRYDVIAAFFSGIWTWLKSLGVAVRIRSTPRRLMCAEAVIRTLQDAGYKSVEGMGPELTTPAELLGRLSTSRAEFRPLNVLSI